MEYFSAIKRREILLFVTTWVDLKGILLNEIKSDRQKQILYDLTHVEFKNIELTETESRISGCQGLRDGRNGRGWSKGTNFQV